MNAIAARRRLIGIAVLAASWLIAASGAPPHALAQGIASEAGPDGPAQSVYLPPKGHGPAVLLISGQTGPKAYQKIAADVAALGYYAVLIDGRDVLARGIDGEAVVRKVITRAQAAPQVVRGKTAVVSFSLGGGGSLAYATGMSNLVSMVAAHYPANNFSAAKNTTAFVKKFRVPVLILAAGQDRYKDCCLIENMHAIANEAKRIGATVELVVYPEADHGFNLAGKAFRADDTADAWKRVTAMLTKYQPIAP